MQIFDAAFYAAALFVFGIGVANSGVNPHTQWLLVCASALAIGIYWYRAYRTIVIASLAAMIAIGFLYDDAWTKKHTEAPIIFEKSIELKGVVRRVETDDKKQVLRIGQIQIQTEVYPSYVYGDDLHIKGKIQEPFEKQKNSLLKNGVRGIMYHPRIEHLGSDKGNQIQAALLGIKQGVEQKIKSIFAPQEASLMIGLLVGGRGMFDDEFRAKLAASGTSHLVALSGYNIIIIAGLIAGILFLFGVKSHRIRFVLSVVGISAFVIATGAESSVVRAAFMGMILLLADQIGRVYSVRNAIAIVAAGMLLYNPKLLVFDIGFQLSFVALLGIVYLEPVVRRWLHLEGDPGVSKWKKNLATTIAAQLAVLPIIVTAFGTASWIGVIANVLIIGLVPSIMTLGFVVVLASVFSSTLAWMIAFPTSMLLQYVIGIIEVADRIGGTPAYHMSIVEILAYYAILIFIAKQK